VAAEHDVAATHPKALDPSDLLADAALLPAVETPPFAQFFASTTVTGSMRITPLLTPDPGVYVDAVRALVESATSTLHMQFQYIKLPATTSSDNQAFVDLVGAVTARQKAGVDVKIVMAQWETAGYLEQLQAAGLDVQSGVRIQGNVHNKGIVVDGRAALVSSQNWSSDGVLHNRDAGVIIEHADVAAYFDKVFLHDWEHLATAKTAAD
jgi:phosphatidylserine/phosphatidylglycerophosphate/cardiolipin synthase-like enzyme